ncbi:MAG: hypothetical protein DMF50_00990 [Acidobacteria bacterium]|nr:MAG: hypothetical protein DMF50_00990 [Acidobacteriota bacterium]
MSGVAPLRHLGRIRLVAVGINSVIGGGIFILPATVTALIGAAGLPAYAVAGVVVVGIGLTLASLAARHEASGGPYLYVHRAFGSFAGFQVGWLFCLARLTAMAGLMNGFAQYLGALAPWGTGLLPRTAMVLCCAGAVVGLNVAGIRHTSGAANLLAVVKVVPLVALGLAGLCFIRAERLVPTPFAPMDFLRAVLLLLYAFSGFEILTVPAEESLRPRRDLPFALIATILCVCAVYVLVHTAALGMLPGLGSDRAPLASAAGLIAGSAGRYAMTAIAAVSMAGCSLVSLVGATRLLYAMSSAGQIPAWMGALHAARRTPVAASLLVGGLATVMAIAGGYAELAAVSAGTRLLVFLACCLACLRPEREGPGLPGLGPRDPRAQGPERWGRIVALPSAVAIVALLSGVEPREAAAGMIGVGTGLILYLAARRGRRADKGEEAR